MVGDRLRPDFDHLIGPELVHWTGPEFVYWIGLDLDLLVVTVIVAMAVVTFATKVGGLWILSRIDVSERLEAGLSILPGAIVIAILGPELADGGPAEWAAAGVVLLVAWRTESILLSLCAGVVAVVAFRGVL